MRRRFGRLTNPRFGARHGVLAVFALATLGILLAGMFETRALLTTSLYRAAEQEAGREAQVVANLGLVAALSSGKLSTQDVRLAGREYTAARRDLPLTGAVIWTPNGNSVFAVGTGLVDARQHQLSRIARVALVTHRTQVTYSSEPGVGPTIEAAVPLGSRGLNAVGEFHFSRRAVEQNLDQAKQRLYLLSGAAALVMYLAILPLIARLAGRIPLPPDPRRKAALGELGVALARRELVLHYQPKTELAGQNVAGVEALVRWNHPERGLLAPAEFLPVAESSPPILAALTCQVLDRALRDCAGWLAGGRRLPVAVNLAAATLLEGSLVTIVQETLKRYSVPPSLLTIEITESALMEGRAEVTEALIELRGLGVSLSMDDFGTGHSSLSRLRSLPLDELKVDRSFIANIATDERELGMTRHIIEMGVELGLVVVAEGVEDRRTLELLRTLGCSVAQGFYLSRPLPEPQLREWLDAHEARLTAAARA